MNVSNDRLKASTYKFMQPTWIPQRAANCWYPDESTIGAAFSPAVDKAIDEAIDLADTTAFVTAELAAFVPAIQRAIIAAIIT